MTNLLKQFNLPKNPKRVGNRPVENSALTYFGRLASSIVRTFTKYFNIYSITVRDITWNVAGKMRYYAEYFLKYRVFHYISCYFAEIWITFRTVYTFKVPVSFSKTKPPPPFPSPPPPPPPSVLKD